MRATILAVVLAVAACGPAEEGDPPVVPAALTYDGASTPQPAARVAHGARLTDVLGCTGCHGKQLQGELFADEKGFGRIHASNLSVRLPNYSDAQIEAALRRGVRPDGSELWAMPSAMYTHLSGPDMAALIAYLRTLPPTGPDTPPLRMDAGWKAEIAAGKYKSAPGYIAEEKGIAPLDLGPQHARARMITMTACTECHAAKLEGREGDTPSLDIVGAYSKDQFTTLMRTGKPASGKELRMMSGVARWRFAKLTDQEVSELYDYLEARAKAPH